MRLDWQGNCLTEGVSHLFPAEADAISSSPIVERHNEPASTHPHPGAGGPRLLPAQRHGRSRLASQGLAIQFEQWEGRSGSGSTGFWRYARHKEDAELQASLLAWYEGQIARGLPAMQINTTAPMITLALLAGHSGRADLRETVNAWADDLMANLPRTEEGGFQHVVKEQPNTGQLWDDTLHDLPVPRHRRDSAGAPGSDRRGRLPVPAAHYLSEPRSGLWYHGRTFLDRHHYAEAFWARGNAWITVAIPEFIDLMGDHLDAGVRRYFSPRWWRARCAPCASCRPTTACGAHGAG